jgi:RecA/RadA recombinase
LSPTEFKTGLQLLRDLQSKPKLTTGSADLDSLIGGGIELGVFYLFYGEDGSGVDFLMHQILVNSLLPIDKYGFDGKAVYLNCGNYKHERTVLDVQLLTFLIKANRMDPMSALEDIYAIPVYSEEQEGEVALEVAKLLEKDKEVKLVVAHNISKPFTASEGTPNKNRLERILRLQGVVGKLSQACAKNNVAFVASCRPKQVGRWRVPQPEGGKYLRHLTNVMVYLRKGGERSPYISAFLLKHPNRAPKRIDFAFTVGGTVMGRITIPFRTVLQEELDSLKRSFKEALVDPAKRDAFDCLMKAWTSEQGAMSYARVPTVLDVMLLTAAVDNRRIIEDLIDQMNFLKSEVENLKVKLEEAKVSAKVEVKR